MKEQKNDLIQIQSNERSFLKLESLKTYTQIFSKVSISLDKESSSSSIAKNIINELVSCNESD